MNEKVIAKGILRSVFFIAFSILIIYFFYLIKSLLLYISIAGVISLINRPIILFLKEKLKFNNILAAISTILLNIFIILGFFSLFLPIIYQQSENLSLLDIDALKSRIEFVFNEIFNYFFQGENNFKNWIINQNLFDNLNLYALPDFLNFLINWLSGVTIGLFSILFILFFFLKEQNLLQKIVLSFTNNDQEIKFKKSFTKIKDLLSRYFIGLLLQIIILFIIYSIILFIFGINNALIIAFLCSILNLIPYLGPIFSGVLLIILTMTSNIDQSFSEIILPQSTYVFFGFILAQLIDNFISQPFIFSKSIKSHPLEIFIIIIVFGIIFGIVGLIIAIPVYTALKVIFLEFNNSNKIIKSITKNF